jgi:hypothetical protein
MKVARLAGLMLIAVLAVSLAAASAASAAPALSYLFSSGSVGAGFTGTSLAGKLVEGENIVKCASDTNTGTIANVHLLGPFDITFTGCESSSNNGGSFCPVHSENVSTSGVILTFTVHALLGTVLPSELPGLLVLPTSGTRFVQLAANACTILSTISGTVAGLLFLGQIGHLILESLVSFLPEDIKEIHTLNGLVKPRLEFGGINATLETLEHIVWTRDIEVEAT